MKNRKVLLIISMLLSSALCHAQSVVEIAQKYVDGRFEEVVQMAESAIQTDSLDAAFHYYRGSALFALGSVDDGAAELQRAVELDPSVSWYYDPLIEYCYKNNLHERLENLCLQVHERFPNRYNSAFMHSILADAYRRRGNIPAFFTETRALVKDETLSPKLKAQCVDDVLRMCDANTFRYWHAQLDSLVDYCVSLAPEDSSTLKMAGIWYYGTLRKERAYDYFTRWIRAYPRSVSAWEVRLEVLAREGDRDGVIATAKHIVALDPKEKLQMYSIIGDSYHELGNSRLSYSYYEKALKIDSSYAPVLNNYAYFLSLDGKHLKKAEKMAAKVIEQYPDNATYLDTYGWILHLRGKDAEARNIFKKAFIYGGKDNPDVVGHYADVLDALGEKGLAEYYRTKIEK